ncbi:ABC transporter permease [Dyadobacter psychrotolerans]|uniref:FtsX-like permease family protein n=1 Tax=Dyadobacter psychrotolerans TaxID=2541721 RepID=A0A4R5DA17_9BACT|nr:ABC transporter permease [Dyadobacter psychrotolerans]TDE08284.1 FtsX-like permease family protein [Dyadobacter psychrotolerans]
MADKKSTNTNSGPPVWATWLLSSFSDPNTSEELQGDLLEMYDYWSAGLGKSKAKWKYIYAVFRLLRPLARKKDSENYQKTYGISPGMLKSYFKIGARNLLKNKGYSAINIFGLAIGVSACIVIYLLVSFELSYENFQPDKERIYRVTSGFQNSQGVRSQNAGLSAPMPEHIRKEITGLESLAACHVWNTNTTVAYTKNGKNPSKVWKNDQSQVLICEAEYFQIFKYEWLLGSAQSCLQAPNEVVLTQSEAEKYFGAIPLQQVLGKRLYFSDSLITTVSGIVKDLPSNSDFKFKNFISFKSIQTKAWRKEFQLDEWTNTNSSSMAFVKVANKVTASQIDKQFPAFLNKYLDTKDEWNKGRTLDLQPLSDIHYNQEIKDNFSRQVHLPSLYALMGIAVFLLLIAAINFINLATAQSINRIKEIGVRKVLGSSRKSLIIQFLCETFVITFAAVLLSLSFIEPILSAFEKFVPQEFSFSILDPKLLGFVALIAALTSLLSGLYPAWVISSYTPIASLKNQVSFGRNGGVLLRKSLITFQFVASQIFILGTIIMAAQSRFMLNKDLGFNKDAIIHFQTDWHDSEIDKKDILIQKLRQIPEIENVSIGTTPALRGYSTNRVSYHDGKNEIKLDVHRRAVDENYIPMFGLKLVAGRNITNSDTAKEFVINQTYAKMLGFKKPEDAIGKMLTYSGGKGDINLPIVGVVSDFHLQSLHTPIKPLYILSENKYENAINVKVRTGGNSGKELNNVIGKMEVAYKEVFTTGAVEFSPLFFNETVGKFYQKEQRLSQILNTATGVAILISCMGLFGLAAFVTRQRTKEIGIRKVLGSTASQILVLLSRDFLRLVVLSIFIASPIAYLLMKQWLQDFAYRVDISWWIFALAAGVSIVVAILTVGYQSLRAALLNPVESLKVE